MKFESLVSNNGEQLERAAEYKLQDLLDDPENKFLEQIPLHKNFLDGCLTSIEALEYAERMIQSRLEKNTNFIPVGTIEGVSLENVNAKALKESVLSILANQKEIGRGGDAFVVIDKNEVRNLPPEICYKFAIEESTPRGRNPMTEEAEIQGAFYDAVVDKSDSKIGVPIPFYVLETGFHRMIAMEKLPAASIDDILRGKGSLPGNFNVDEFCKQLHILLKYLHEKGLYHRDMHPGNVMITQKEVLEPEDKWGYIIDFGLSGSGLDEDTAYEKTLADNIFTYSDDYGILNTIKSSLRQYQGRISS